MGDTTASEIKGGYVTGQCLVAMPGLADPNFARTVIYICAHTEDGAMGLVVNRPILQLSFPEIIGQLGIEATPACDNIRVHFGGPVEAARGFVLHSAEYVHETTLLVDSTVALTATTDVLRAMAEGTGPRQSLMTLGYAGWSPGQLDAELKENAWLTVESDAVLLFETATEKKWDAAIRKLGIDPAMLNESIGHA